MLNVKILEGEAKPGKHENHQWESKNNTSDSEEHEKPTFNPVNFTRPSPKIPERRPGHGGKHNKN